MDYKIEEELLGNILLKPDLMAKIVVSEECFFEPKNKFIFKLFKQQYQDSRTINIATIATNYSHMFNEKFKINDIIEKLTFMMTEAFPIPDLNYFQSSLFERYRKSKILNSINAYQKENISTEELLNDIHKFETLNIKLTTHQLNAEEIFRLISTAGININFRFKTLSKHANIQEHDLVVVAARTGIGKSGFILNLLEDLSNNYNCVLFNMEMADNQVYKRLVSINTGIAMSYHNNPKTEYQEQQIKEGCKRIANKNIKIINNSQTIASIRRTIVNESRKGHTIAFIDYVGLIVGDKKYTTSYERVTAIVKELRQISLDYDCTIFLVSQLNRNSENNNGKDKMPKILDLKESGELEQSATTVLLLYDENHNNNLSKSEIDISVIIAKNRNGKVGTIGLHYNKENQRYDDIEKNVGDPNAWRKE